MKLNGEDLRSLPLVGRKKAHEALLRNSSLCAQSRYFLSLSSNVNDDRYGMFKVFRRSIFEAVRSPRTGPGFTRLRRTKRRPTKEGS